MQVLIAGGGTVGLAAAVFLAHHGVQPLIVERRSGPSVHPRATGVGPRTVEFLREADLEDALNAVAIRPPGRRHGKLYAPTLATADFPPVPRESPMAAVQPATPTALRGLCPQNRLDTVLLSGAQERGARIAYSTRLESFTHDADGVTATLSTGEVVRADYLIAADGARSDVRTALGIGTTGPGRLGRAMTNILFHADLAPYTRGHAFVNCTITGPDAPGMLVTVDGEKEWIFHAESETDLSTSDCAALIRTAVGDPGLEVEVVSALRWQPQGLLADAFRTGRVFLAGDAAHAVPPIGAFGANAGIADAHNLAWKLAAVLSGHAGPLLLDTYEAERRPVAAVTLEQAMLRLRDPRLHWDTSAVAERAAAGVLNAPIVHMGQRYVSDAVVDPQPELPSTEDIEAVLDGTPGSRLPHLWQGSASTLDLAGSRFTLFSASPAWNDAARAAGLPVVVVDDPTWPELTGTDADGALLVRPDQVVGWRAHTLPTDPAGALTAALTKLLGRTPSR